MKTLNSIIWAAFALATALIGHQIHGSVFWSIVDLIFPFFAWAKWIICKQVSVSIIKVALAPFLA